MFYKDSGQIYRARPLEGLAWLDHGFGTRHSNGITGHPEPATLHQVHSDLCILAEGRSGRLGEGDALLENTPGRRVAVKTADCLPVLLADARNRAVAAVHAGWRGVQQEIAAKAVRAMTRIFGTRPEDIHAAIGPGIGPCCFEVGPEVAARFGIQTGEKVKIDLFARVERQLAGAGLDPRRISSSRICTVCRPEDFFSYRREKQHAGRMYSFIGVR